MKLVRFLFATIKLLYNNLIQGEIKRLLRTPLILEYTKKHCEHFILMDKNLTY